MAQTAQPEETDDGQTETEAAPVDEANEAVLKAMKWSVTEVFSTLESLITALITTAETYLSTEKDPLWAAVLPWQRP